MSDFISYELVGSEFSDLISDQNCHITPFDTPDEHNFTQFHQHLHHHVHHHFPQTTQSSSSGTTNSFSGGGTNDNDFNSMDISQPLYLNEFNDDDYLHEQIDLDMSMMKKVSSTDTAPNSPQGTLFDDLNVKSDVSSDVISSMMQDNEEFIPLQINTPGTCVAIDPCAPRQHEYLPTPYQTPQLSHDDLLNSSSYSEYLVNPDDPQIAVPQTPQISIHQHHHDNTSSSYTSLLQLNSTQNFEKQQQSKSAVPVAPAVPIIPAVSVAQAVPTYQQNERNDLMQLEPSITESTSMMTNNKSTPKKKAKKVDGSRKRRTPSAGSSCSNAKNEKKQKKAEKRFKCRICTKASNTRYQHEKHHRDKHSTKSYYFCFFCNNSFNGVEHVRRHLKEHCHSEKLLKIKQTFPKNPIAGVSKQENVCIPGKNGTHTFEYVVVQGKKSKNAQKRRADWIISKKSIKEFVVYRCPDCNINLPSIDALAKHTSKEHYTCECCSLRVLPGKFLELHVDHQHCGFFIKCDTCAELFSGTNDGEFAKHYAEHNEMSAQSRKKGDIRRNRRRERVG